MSKCACPTKQQGGWVQWIVDKDCSALLWQLSASCLLPAWKWKWAGVTQHARGDVTAQLALHRICCTATRSLGKSKYLLWTCATWASFATWFMGRNALRTWRRKHVKCTACLLSLWKILSCMWTWTDVVTNRFLNIIPLEQHDSFFCKAASTVCGKSKLQLILVRFYVIDQHDLFLQVKICKMLRNIYINIVSLRSQRFPLIIVPYFVYFHWESGPYNWPVTAPFLTCSSVG